MPYIWAKYDVMKIAVIGATGLLGRPVTQELIKAGYAVTIVARDPAKAQALFPNAKVVQGDVQDLESLRNAFEGQQALYLSLSVEQTETADAFHTETDGMQHIIEAAKQTGIRRIAYLSSIVMRYQGMNGFKWWVFDIKFKAVQLLKASGIPITVFYPSTFMESFYIQKQGNKIGTVGKSKQKMWFVAAQDYGKQVAKSFEVVPDGESKHYAIQGPEGYTYHEAVKLFTDHYTKEKLSELNIPLWVTKLVGLGNQRMNYASRICEALNNYPEKFVAENTWSELGQPQITIEAFAKRLS